uniref:Uncharacterized protein n=1 Tax=Arundo donax TaxID=35708 RepID=A0A0A9BRX2_ARUDO
MITKETDTNNKLICWRLSLKTVLSIQVPCSYVLQRTTTALSPPEL